MSNKITSTSDYANIPMCDFSPCDVCKKYPCPYYYNVLMHNANSAQYLTCSISNVESKITNLFRH